MTESWRVAVTIAVRRPGAPWSAERTLTLAYPEEAIVAAWRDEFPRMLARSITGSPEPQAEEPDEPGPD